MRFDICSIFPESFDSYFGASILKRAQASGKIEIRTWNIRDFARDKHGTTDDTPYGGGAGMLMKPEPLFECVDAVLAEGPSREETRVILFSAKGKLFTEKDAVRLTRYKRLILLCGRYEGVDERVAEHLADEEVSIGEYVLTGGELPAMVVTDAVARLLGGVLGNDESAQTESHTEEGVLECPQYTKPEEYRGYSVPKVLLSGHHAEIERWRKEHSKKSDMLLKG